MHIYTFVVRLATCERRHGNRNRGPGTEVRGHWPPGSFGGKRPDLWPRAFFDGQILVSLRIRECARLMRDVSMKVVLGYSGGLDTSVIVPWLKENYDAEVICMAGDVGQPGGLVGLCLLYTSDAADE